MPTNLLKNYPELLEIIHLDDFQKRRSLLGVFKQDIEDNALFKFRTKQIRPTKKEGEDPMQRLYRHLTTRDDKDEKGKKTGHRSFETARLERLHWIKVHIDQNFPENLEVFSYEDRIEGRDIIRTYIYDKAEEYVIILEPQKSGLDYYLLTAYYLNEPGGKKQILKKFKKKLDDVY